MGEFIATERLTTGVELIRLTRPPMNALSGALLTELADHLGILVKDTDLKAVVITGNDKVFAAGADINDLGGERHTGMTDAFRRAADAMAAIPRPVIAAISGYALGGGLEVALAADLRVASESARLGVPEILLGVFPGAGGTQRLPRLVGPAKAKEMLWSGRQVKADEALQMGLVDRVVPAGGYLEAALEWAGEFARGAVVAMGLSKQAVDGGLDLTLDESLDLERELFAKVLRTEDAGIGIKSFLEDGPGQATFVGR
ncbi:MAG: enoyl-CoA hydratase/isomerase family protein [Acidimicrobiia bacterium]